MMSTKTVEFIKQYKDYNSVCEFYKKIIGSCSQCPLNPFSCGTFSFYLIPIESLVEVLEKWRDKNGGI